MRILLCEDQDTIRHMIEALVGSSGHEVVAVAFGTQAVEHAMTEHFDLMLLDLMLPGSLDGFAVCERLRAEEATRRLPIFVLSALDNPESRERARVAGATAFYGKPFSPLELLEGINAVGQEKGAPR